MTVPHDEQLRCRERSPRAWNHAIWSSIVPASTLDRSSIFMSVHTALVGPTEYTVVLPLAYTRPGMISSVQPRDRTHYFTSPTISNNAHQRTRVSVRSSQAIGADCMEEETGKDRVRALFRRRCPCVCVCVFACVCCVCLCAWVGASMCACMWVRM